MESINIKELNDRIQRESSFVDILTMEMNKVIVGQKNLVENLLIGLLANGHILLEGVPGLAKTLAINTLSQAVDSHNLGRGRGRVEDVLRQIKAKSLVVAITSDILFPPSDHTILVENIPDVRYHVIDSDFGHDGFLVEHKQLNDIIIDFLNE